MTSNPDIAVLLPVFNSERYLEKAIESVLNQSYENFELIIINDGSTDASYSIIQKYAKLDRRVKIISRENKGLVASLNEGLSHVFSPLIARMDSDDIALPHRFFVQKNYLAAHPDVVAVGSKVRVIDGAGRFLIDTKPVLDHTGIVRSALRGVSPLIHPSAMIRTSALLEIGGYRSDYYPAEDLGLWIDLCEVGELANQDEALLEYRIHDGSISTARHEEQLKKTYEICAAACEKRGVAISLDTKVGRPGSSRISKYEIVVRHGWWAFSSGEWKTALIYGLKGILCIPIRVPAWRLFYCSIFRRKP